MFPRPSKRKHRASAKSRQRHRPSQHSEHAEHGNNSDDEHELESQPDPALFIQAYEADLVRGPQAWAAADSLEVVRVKDGDREVVKAGEGLIRWGGAGNSRYEDEEVQAGNARQQEIWVDRYDARLLLDALPSSIADTQEPLSPTLSTSGWSDLPSDSEDTFFFTPAELEDYHRQKRRRIIDAAREERLRALREEDDTTFAQNPEEDRWGGSDEEPDAPQRELMRRTAVHLSTSPNPAQLEMRILANHGADKRFAFLRGRWSRAWRTVKAGVRQEQARAKEKESEKPALGGLAGYGDSDEDEGSEKGGDDDRGGGSSKREIGEAQADAAGAIAEEQAGDTDKEEAMKAARRAKAKEWAAKRKAAKEAE
ncbi:hypothetical protein GLOTRDRAFT_140022 [Gloeophyllum trabeum ATCC 11539]|uniref:Suppressor of white apricot N-terminal domain-containing protein n=1 Tax=Gloeophyllum trabeum (strain ATCC 11539 / FP-39264 / Madison 617) TaxID=670483 RepID=S7Q0R5_GLOTA|nr:uncharacterized protein GLOTRDRAFT_140022 [Gloeophyllum trabeum ATCC 11539]EPQ53087.1 hypothetical protein GLOTRDRAFT_140022 [Gloeophyllum trabeum ATCC 11539]